MRRQALVNFPVLDLFEYGQMNHNVTRGKDKTNHRTHQHHHPMERIPDVYTHPSLPTIPRIHPKIDFRQPHLTQERFHYDQ
jgi:hypothetical protein